MTVNRYTIRDAMKSIRGTIQPHTSQLVSVFVGDRSTAPEAQKQIYRAMSKSVGEDREYIAFNVVTAYCAEKGIKCKFVRLISLRHIQVSKRKGNCFEIKAIVDEA